MPILFRIAGLLVALVSGAISMAEVVAGGPAGLARRVPTLPPGKQAIAFYLLLSAAAATLFLFCLLFWKATARPPAGRKNWRILTVLGIQLMIGILFPDLMIIVACEAGFLLTTRLRSGWMCAQAAFFFLFILVSGAQGWLSVAPELTKIAQAPGIALTVVQAFVWQLFAFAAGYMAGREFESRRDLLLANGELRATQQVLSDSARINERLNISRELHDTIGHHLAALSLKLQLALRLAKGDDRKPVEQAHLVARLLLSDVRAAVSSMREEGAVDLASALRTVCASIDTPRVELNASEAGTVRDPAKAQVLLRCVQEAITNAIRHAQATAVSVRLRTIGQELELEIQDDGRGSSRLTPGNGLRGMRERVEAAGGNLQIETAPGKGFRLLAHLPAPEAAASS